MEYWVSKRVNRRILPGGRLWGLCGLKIWICLWYVLLEFYDSAKSWNTRRVVVGDFVDKYVQLLYYLNSTIIQKRGCYL